MQESEVIGYSSLGPRSLKQDEGGFEPHPTAAAGPWGTEMRSCSWSVLVQETAEQVASVDPGWRVAADEGHSSGWIRRLKLQRPVGAMSVVVRDVHLESPLQVPPPHDQ